MYAKVELPSDDGGVPGARTAAGGEAERGRLSGGVTDQDVTEDEETADDNVETQTVQSE